MSKPSKVTCKLCGEEYLRHPDPYHGGSTGCPVCGGDHERARTHALGRIQRVLASVGEKDDRWVEQLASAEQAIGYTFGCLIGIRELAEQLPNNAPTVAVIAAADRGIEFLAEHMRRVGGKGTNGD